MKNIDLLAESCQPAAPETPKTPEPFKLSDDMVQRVAERVVQLLSQPATDPADPDPEPEASADPDPEPETGGDTE